VERICHFFRGVKKFAQIKKIYEIYLGTYHVQAIIAMLQKIYTSIKLLLMGAGQFPLADFPSSTFPSAISPNPFSLSHFPLKKNSPRHLPSLQLSPLGDFGCGNFGKDGKMARGKWFEGKMA
jgi:hypothetical protein